MDSRNGLTAICGRRSRLGSALFGRLFGPVEQNLLPVDSVEFFLFFGQLFPDLAKAIEFDPLIKLALQGLVRWQMCGHILPTDSGNQDIKIPWRPSRFASGSDPRIAWQQGGQSGPTRRRAFRGPVGAT
jgi:hypothetical protein